VVTETTEGITLAITVERSGKVIVGVLFSDGNVQAGVVCWVEPSGLGGIDIWGGNREQALILSVSVISIRINRKYLILLSIFVFGYYIIITFSTEKSAPEFRRSVI
jgi:hypothetical protein